MQHINRIFFTLMLAALTTVILAAPRQALAADVAQIERDAIAALAKLYDTTPAAKVLGDKAKAILVFPSILKAGLIIGGQGGNGALFVDGKVVGFYNTAAASYGLQAGAQEFAYAMFLMTDAAIESVKKADGWEVKGGTVREGRPSHCASQQPLTNYSRLR